MILVTGATGSIGRHLVRRLRQQDIPLRAFVRDPDRGRELGCELAVGDFDDPDSIEAALSGVERVFLCSPGAGPAPGPQPMVAQQTRVIDAAVRAGVRRVVKVSVRGARPGGLLAEGGHAEIEARLEASGLDWSIVQPSGFMQNFLTGAGTFTDGGDLLGAYGSARVSYIDCADIAACADVLLRGDLGTRQRFVLTGPEALTHAEIAARLSEALGRTIVYIDRPPVDFAADLVAQGLPDRFAADVAALYADVACGSLAGITSAVRDLTGRPATTFAEFLAREQDLLRQWPTGAAVEKAE
ncbi:NAD(P)H-binding protein [Nocardia jiangxiensis]|uniref:NAD(P)H-binding protein n=1 Tax=Nocardia jiangxiensis TaxID=282685 RepID=A0ABW6SB03_9NOCA|nr:NAD(P)H-binding protein [Nocardia jiangxiensis]